MASRADKSLLLFSTGEVTPLLAGRTDVEKITAGCRTLQNMVVDTGGGATRRAGTQYIASAAGIAACPELGRQWYTNVLARGGTANLVDRNIICELCAQLLAKSYYNQIWYMAPFAGRDLLAALTPVKNLLLDDMGEAAGTFELYPVGMTDANYDPAFGLVDADATHYLLQGTGRWDRVTNPPGGALAVGGWELGNIVDAGDRGMRMGFLDDRSGFGAPDQFAARWQTQVTVAEARAVVGNREDLFPSEFEVAMTYAKGQYVFAHDPGLSGRIWQNGTLLLNDTSVTARADTMRAVLMGTGFINFGSANAGIEPDSVLPATDSVLGCYFVLDGAVTTETVADLYATLRDYLIEPYGRI